MHLQIAIAGRTNAGKSSLFNLISGQDAAITSAIAGTTTDVVEKAMELRPVGPVLLLDTPGIDDAGTLGALRVGRSCRAFDRADVMVLVTLPGIWGEPEELVLHNAADRNVRVIAVVNLLDGKRPDADFLNFLREKTSADAVCVRADRPETERDAFLERFREVLIAAMPEDFLEQTPLLGDLVKAQDVVILIVPVDIQAPKGRLILPQVQSLRDALDHSAMVLTVKETEYAKALATLKTPPQLVVCDSQAVALMMRETPPGIPCTTFSILFSRLRGDMILQSAGAGAISQLKAGDRVLIAEACTHHASDSDIGRVKIPRLLEKRAGGKLNVTVFSGRDYPPDLAEYDLIVHCGSCMLNRRETLRRMELARRSGVPVTNYGMAISECQGVLERALSPFPDALASYLKSKCSTK